MKTKMQQPTEAALQVALESFANREISRFVTWAKESWQENAPAVLSVNPPNHVYDVEDGSIDLTLGSEQVQRKLDHHKEMVATIFSYKLLKVGSFREVTEYLLRSLTGDEQLEGAMAFYLDSNNGSYLCNCGEWRSLSQNFDMAEGLENGFYKGVAEMLLKNLWEVVGD